MSRLFYHTCQDNLGNLLFDVSGTMRLAGSGTLATIYGDEALTTILPNPMTNHPSFGSFKCFLGVGDYDFYLSKAGYTFETLTGVQGSGTMADQNASAVAITGGTITLPAAVTTGGLIVTNVAGNDVVGVRTEVMTGGTTRYNLFCGGTAPNYFGGGLGVRAVPLATANVYLGVPSGIWGLVSYPTDQASAAVADFRNQSLVSVGAITTNATATTYNTASDARLKKDITPLTGALDVVRRLNPITHLWRSDDSKGVGFLANEVADVVGGVITGERDAVDEEGRIVPQMIDMSKLVPYLTAALKDALEAVDLLTARVAALEGAIL